MSKVKDLDTQELRERAEVEYDLENYSDAYKEMYGVRPRGDYKWFRELARDERSAVIQGLFRDMATIAGEGMDR